MIIKINNGIIKEVKDIRTFYNEDCAKWGVQTFGNLWGDCMGDRWQQVFYKDEPYTKYKNVAVRWLNNMIVK